MPHQRIDDLSRAGFVPDRHPAHLPPQAFTDVRNVVFQEGAAERSAGFRELLNESDLEDIDFDTSEDELVAVQPAIRSSQWLEGAALLFLGKNKAIGYAGALPYDVTPSDGDLNGGRNQWTGGNLFSSLVVNNPQDPPLMWPEGSTDTPLEELPGWPDSWRAEILRVYRGIVVVGGTIEDDGDHPSRVRWSDAAVPGDSPWGGDDPWDETVEGTMAGYYDLSGTPGRVVDIVPHRDQLIIYKSDSVWSMQFIGGQYVFRFRQISATEGLLTRNCAVPTPKGQVALSPNDLILTDGQRVESLLGGRARRWLFRSIDKDNFDQTFLMTNYRENEVWVVFPEEGHDLPSAALTWNWEHNTLSVRDAKGFRGASLTPVEMIDSVPWESDEPPDWYSGSGWPDREWEDVTEPWISNLFGTRIIRPVVVRGSDAILGTSGISPADLEDPHLRLKRDMLPVVGEAVDMESVATIRAVWLKGSGDMPGRLRVGTRLRENDIPDWSPWYEFTLDDVSRVDLVETGRIFAIEIEAEGSGRFRLSGIDLEYKVTGRY